MKATQRVANSATTASFKRISPATSRHVSIPNPKPEHISPRIDRLIGSSHFLRCVVYGVQDAAAPTLTDTADVTSAEAETASEATPAAFPSTSQIPKARSEHVRQLVDKRVKEVTTMEAKSQYHSKLKYYRWTRSKTGAFDKKVAVLLS
jgi:hypothetical protein